MQPVQHLSWAMLLLIIAFSGSGKAAPASTPSSTQLRRTPSAFGTDDWLIDTWETQDGPTEFTSTAMVQTSDGYLWFSTFGGLQRFDGVKLTTFTAENTSSLPSDGIVNLHLDRRGWLWLSTYAGLVVRQDKQWRAFGKKEGWVGDFVRTFSERTSGDLLMTTFDGHVLEFRGDRLTPLPQPPGTPRQGYLGYVDEKDQWWVVQNRFIGKWDDNRWLPTVSPGSLLADEVGCGRARDGGLWLFLGKELQKYRDTKLVARRALPPKEYIGGFWSLFEDSREDVWIATYDRGLCQVSADGQLHFWSTTNGLPANGVRFVFEDRENDLWIGTGGGGLTRFKPRRVRNYGRERGLASGVNSVGLDGAGGLLVGTYGEGLFRWNESGIRRMTWDGIGFSASYLQSVLADKHGRVWLGTSGNGLWVAEQQTAKAIPPERTQGNNVIALFEDSRGQVWIGGGGLGISVFDGTNFRCLGEQQGVPRNYVCCFAEDSKGAIWLTDQAGVFRLEGERFVEIRTAENRSVKGVGCFKCDPDGAVWMGSMENGLLRWRDRQWATLDPQSGFPQAAIYSILEDANGFFWLTSDLGIIRISRMDLQAVLDGEKRTLAWQVLDRSDGLQSLSFSVNRQPSNARDATGRLWFSTGKGLATIDPRQFRLNTVEPKVHIERVVWHTPISNSPREGSGAGPASETEFKVDAPFDAPLRLPPGSHRIEIYYTAPCFSAPEKVRFQVRMDLQDREWHDAAGQRLAEFYELPPGRYTFRVRAANPDGVWNEAGTSLSFAVVPFLWQTVWFRISGILVFITLGGLTAWSYSARKHRRKLQQLERARIQEAELAHVARVSTMGELAASVAHELNQPLGAILSNAEAAEMFLNASPPLLEDVREILVDIRKDDERAGEVIRRMRALLRRREMEMEPIELNSVVEDVFGLVSADAALRKTLITADLSPRIPRVNGDRVHLQQVLLNLIMNALEAMGKHATDKRRILVRTRVNGENSVELLVTDSGQGIDPEKAARLFEPFFTTKPNGMGMGLSIAKRIVEAHHGRISAENNPVGGATFRVTLPIPTQDGRTFEI